LFSIKKKESIEIKLKNDTSHSIIENKETERRDGKDNESEK